MDKASISKQIKISKALACLTGSSQVDQASIGSRVYAVKLVKGAYEVEGSCLQLGAARASATCPVGYA
jgi:hypothetical protein